MKNYKLYGAKISLYTGKVRSYLINKNIPYEEVTASIKVYKKIIIPKTGVRFIPVVETPEGEFIQDTTIIIDELEKRFSDNSISPRGPKQRLIARLFELIADEWLLIPAMHYRWNKDQENYIYQEFGKTALPGWPSFVQRYLGKKVGSKFRGFVEKLGINTNTIPAIENWYENQFLTELDQHFAEHSYLLGGRACIGDFALMGPLYAHLYLDPESGKLMRQIAPNVCNWIERMNSVATPGEWLDGDEVPDSLLRTLEPILRDITPLYVSIVNETSQWRETNPSQPIPRVIGKHDFNIGDAHGERLILPFSQWKLQRLQQVLQESASDERDTIDNWLDTIGGKELLYIDIKNPLKRVNNKLDWQ